MLSRSTTVIVNTSFVLRKLGLLLVRVGVMVRIVAGFQRMSDDNLAYFVEVFKQLSVLSQRETSVLVNTSFVLRLDNTILSG